MIDVVIETISGDLCFEYNIVSGGVREDVSKYIVVEYATSANCVWLDLVVTGNEVGAENSNNQYGDGDRLPLLLRAGTGSTDATGFVSWSGAYQDWIWGTTVQGKYHGENKFFEQLQPTIISTYFVTRAQYKKEWILLPQLLIHQEFTKGIKQHNYLIPGTGTNIILAGAGLETYYRKTGFSISLQLPIYQEVYYMDMKIGGHFCVGVSYNFGSEKYLLH